jgi:hypothetical protein
LVLIIRHGLKGIHSVEQVAWSAVFRRGKRAKIVGQECFKNILFYSGGRAVSSADMIEIKKKHVGRFPHVCLWNKTFQSCIKNGH